MATYRVRDRRGGTLEVSSKDQADYWVGLGYRIVEDEQPEAEPKKPAKRASKKATSSDDADS